MFFRRSIRSLISLPAAAVALSASTALAQGRPLFDWTGRVDREVRIVMHGRDARTQSVGRYETQRSRLDVATALPQRDGRVFVRVQDGRGDVDVVQQPSARNNFTTIVRIRDRSNGNDVYRVAAFWAPDNNGNGGWDGRDNYPNRPGRDDDRYGRRDDRDGRRDDRDGRWDDRDGRWNDRYGRDVLRWSGDVDDQLEIRIQGNRIDYRTVSGRPVRNVNADLTRGGLPRSDVEVIVTDRSGRGSVSVVQQPSSRNNYTTVIRVYDPRSGYGGYQFDLSYRNQYSARH